MKVRGALLLVMMVITVLAPTYAQVLTPKSISTTANSGGFYEYLPKDYNTGTASYPLIVFVHGIGELGSGSQADLSKLQWTGLVGLINVGNFPVSFTVNNQNFSFIVISPPVQKLAIRLGCQ